MAGANLADFISKKKSSPREYKGLAGEHDENTLEWVNTFRAGYLGWRARVLWFMLS